uniref:Uncharacterized protein LOC105637593 n=2 Tax=Rhizophora mucronata TaxID=61149 RepID=A0A2P2LDD9_RHIMU
MDNSWQLKCASALPSVPSSSTQEPPPPNQAKQDLSSKGHGRVAISMIPNRPTLSSYNLDHANMENSFLSLLYGPASILQCEFQDLLNPKSASAPSKLPAESSIVAASAIGSQALPSYRPLSENVSCQSMQSGANLFRPSSFQTLASSTSIMQFGLPAVDSSLQSSNVARAVSQQMVPGNEEIKGFPSLREQWHSKTPVNAEKLQKMNIQLQQKLPLEAEDSVSYNSSTFSRECPRVYCLTISGDLLLSNTGLLGIVCSCHNFHMSVSKFCEHAGLWHANPGDVVYMDGGETIAMWRKGYFQKFGIRVPEDQSGWDWPQGLSFTANLMNSGASRPNALKNSDCNYLLHPSGGLVTSGKPLEDSFFPKMILRDQNSGIDDLQKKQHRHGLEGLVGISQRNSCVMNNDRVKDCPISTCLAMPKFVGREVESGCQSLSAYRDAMVNIGSLSAIHASPQNLRTPFQSSEAIIRAKNAMDGVTGVEDIPSSSIELKLGRPYQRRQSLGDPALSVMGPQLCNMFVDSQRQFSKKRMIHDVINYGEEEEFRQCLPCDTGLSNSFSRREQCQLNYEKHVISNAMDVGKKQKFNGNMAGTSVVSPSEYFSTMLEGTSHSKAANKVVNISEIMAQKPSSDSHAVKCGSGNIPWILGNSMQSPLTVPDPTFCRSRENGEGVGSFAGKCAGPGLGPKIHNWLENACSLTGVVGESNFSGYPAVHDSKWHVYQPSSALPNKSEGGSFSKSLEKLPFVGSSGHTDHLLQRAVESTLGSPKNLPSQKMSIALPPSTLMPTTELTPALMKQESIGGRACLFDDYLRSLALREMLELSEQHARSSLGKILEQGRCGQSSNVEVQGFCMESSASVEPRHGSNITGSCNCCNFSMLGQGSSLQCKDSDMQCQFIRHLLNEQSSSRHGSSKNDICPSSEHECCCQRTKYHQHHCKFAAHTECLGRKCKLMGGDPSNFCGGHMHSVNNKAPVSIVSQSVRDHKASEVTTFPVDPHRRSEMQLHKTNGYNFSQWHDVGNREACEMTCTEHPANTFGRRSHEWHELGDTVTKCSNVVDRADYSNEHEMSNISSGCCTPAVTQVSIEVNNLNSSTVVGDTGYVSNVIDEGSHVDKCWSSDDAVESDRNAEFHGATYKTSPSKGTCEVINNQLCRSLLDEVKLMDSLMWKKGRYQNNTDSALHGKKYHSQDLEQHWKAGKRKIEMKPKTLDASLGAASPEFHDKYQIQDGTAEGHSLAKDLEMVPFGHKTSCKSAACLAKPHFKHGKPTSSLAKSLSCKRDLQRLYDERDGEVDHKAGANVNANCQRILDVSCRKKFRSTGIYDSHMDFKSCGFEGNIVADSSANSIKESSSQQDKVSFRKLKPVVYGKYGEISNGVMAGNLSKPVKIVSLGRVLKAAKKCSLPKNSHSKLNLRSESKMTSSSWSSACFDKLFIDNASDDHEMDLRNPMEERKIASTNEDRQFDVSLMMVNEGGNQRWKAPSLPDNGHTWSKPKYKESRKRSLYELSFIGKTSSSKILTCKKIVKFVPKINRRKPFDDPVDTKSHMHEVHIAKRNSHEQKPLSAIDCESTCCVCGSSNEDEVNCLLQCGQCPIRVHQACYGVKKVPKGNWFCRPCRTGSKNIVCVLCGFGGGAMTRALRSQTIVKSLLKAWKLDAECGHKSASSAAKTLQDDLQILHSAGSILENAYPVSKPVKIGQSNLAFWHMDMRDPVDILEDTQCCVNNLKVHNSITAGVDDYTIKQWVHMVCGLWTPGTRCPNVDTMSAFDVSGVSHPRASVVCCICNRPGGSCIQCRVVNCPGRFHPWCAHQKGLLQSEVEGADNENLGFYGRCVLHATCPTNESTSAAVNTERFCQGGKDSSCARTEGYKGRKQDGVSHDLGSQLKGKGKCLVPQEQLNAWIHINGQKSCTQRFSKFPLSDKEFDCRVF